VSAANPRRTPLVNSSDLDIVATYGSEYRGIVQYYLLASDVHRLNRLHEVMRTSLLKTLACKHQSTGQKMAARYKAKIETPHGLRTCLQVTVDRGGRKPLVARFGGIPLKRQAKAVLTDRIPERVIYPRKELPLRLLTGECEVCGQAGNVTVHQIRKLTDLGRPGPEQPEWARIMAKRRRKTLVVCAECHHAIHAEHIAALLTARSLESPLRGNSHGGFGRGLLKRPAHAGPRRAAHPATRNRICLESGMDVLRARRPGRRGLGRRPRHRHPGRQSRRRRRGDPSPRHHLRLGQHERKGADTCAGYLDAKAPYLDYPAALANGWPIATGIIEGACRHIIKDRFDITGARWSLDGAEAILRLRTLHANGDFEQYRPRHLPRERQRIYGLAA
jgi:hypothetical protein